MHKNRPLQKIEDDTTYETSKSDVIFLNSFHQLRATWQYDVIGLFNRFVI